MEFGDYPQTAVHLHTFPTTALSKTSLARQHRPAVQAGVVKTAGVRELSRGQFGVG